VNEHAIHVHQPGTDLSPGHEPEADLIGRGSARFNELVEHVGETV
jgi:hypothetical protein